MKRRRLLGYGGAVLLSAAAGCLDSDGSIGSSVDHDGWPMAGYDAAKTGHHRTASLPSTAPEQLLTTRVGTRSSTQPPLLDDGVVYLVASSVEEETHDRPDSDIVDGEAPPPPMVASQLAAIDPVTDSTVWSTEWRIDKAANFVEPPPAIAADTIFVQTDRSVVEGFETTDGDANWQFDLETHVESLFLAADDRVIAPVVATDERIVIYSRDGLLVVDSESGEKIWQATVSGTEPQPAVGNGAVHVQSSNAIQAYDWETGELRWEYESADTLGPVRHGTVYAGDESDLIAVEDGNEQWRTGVDNLELDDYDWIETVDDELDVEELALRNTLAVDDAQLYACRRGFVHALDAETGAEQWTTPIAEIQPDDVVPQGTPTVGDDLLLVPLSGTIAALDKTDGSVQWTVEGPSGSVGRVAFSDEYICCTAEGELYVYENKNE